MQVSNRRIQMFRCYRPPLIGPKVDLAYVPKDKNLQAEICEFGVWVKELANGTEHMVPYANIESIRLEPEVASITELESKRGPGRPKGYSPNGPA